MKETVTGALIVLILGGSSFAVSQTDVLNNFANETGMSQTEAEKYAEDTKDQAATFTEIGNDTVKAGNDILTEAAAIDCETYMYEWEGSGLSCNDGKTQLTTLGNSEVTVGNCFLKLDEDLGAQANSKISECIGNLDASTAGYKLPMSAKVYDATEIEEIVKNNAFNKSVLKTALES